MSVFPQEAGRNTNPCASHNNSPTREPASLQTEGFRVNGRARYPNVGMWDRVVGYYEGMNLRAINDAIHSMDMVIIGFHKSFQAVFQVDGGKEIIDALGRITDMRKEWENARSEASAMADRLGGGR